MRVTLLVLILLSSTGTFQTANAHATIVLGHFEAEPARLAKGSPFTLTLKLEDPTQVPIEDALVFAELRPAQKPDAEPVRADFSETATPGRYAATATLEQPGAYRVLLRDQTYRQEEANATLSEPLRVGGANAAQDFNFPPTATGSAGWRTWLLWLIGLPIVAALLVTVLVLTRGDGETSGTPGEASGKTSGETPGKPAKSGKTS